MKEPTCRELLDRLNDYAAATDDDVDAIAARVERVLELHAHRRGMFNEWCDECLDEDGRPVKWPCPTVQALDGEEI